MKFVIRGGRKTVIFDTAVPDTPRRTDNALLKALARAYRWRKQIESGEYSSITDLAKAQKVNQSYACRLLRLTLLAPAIVIEILDGRHSHGLTLKQITGPLPVLWADQTALSARNSAAVLIGR
jgi:hypothetical protein